MFEQEITRILDYAAQGISVRVIGAPGSGRTTIAKKVVEELEDQGIKVYSIFAMPSLQKAAFAGIVSLGVDLRSRPSGILGVADLISGELTKPGSRIFVVDDVEHLDPESMSVIDIVQKRTKRPLVTTMSDRPLAVNASALALGRWPEASVEVAPLRFEQTNSLITQILGAPADIDVVARILTKSGGNLRLITRIIHSAVLSKRLVLIDGRWRMIGQTLLNEHLRGTVEAILHGLDLDELRALDTIALQVSHPLDESRKSIEADVLDSLERRGLVSVFTRSDGRLHASVFPPLLGDYLRKQVLGPRKVLSSIITDNPGTPSQRLQAATRNNGTFSEAIAALKGSNFNSAAAARRFHEQLLTLIELHYKAWESEPSVSKAAEFLRVYWGGPPIDPAHIEHIFNDTDISKGDSADLLFFTLTRALWIVLAHDDLPLAKATLRQLEVSEPSWAAEAEAFALFLDASYDRMPEDLDEKFSRLHSKHPSSGVIPAIRGILEIFRFNPEGALAVIDSAEGFDSLPRFEPFIRGLALYSSGRVDEALSFALEGREEALQATDQFSLVTNSYVAALALLYRGHFEEAEYLMGWTFSVCRPGFLVSSLHSAMLRLSSLRNASKDVSLAVQAGEDAPDVGPLPGTGKGVFELVAQNPTGPDTFDESASRLMDEQLERGYVLEAVYGGLFLLCLLPGPRVKARLQDQLQKRGVILHDQLLAFAGAALDADMRLLGILHDTYEPDGDLYQIGMLLRGAAVRFRLSGDAVTSAAMERAARQFTIKFKPGTQYMNFEPELPVSALSVRETEIALLAGHQSNQEIAVQLGLSVRTVESHISNALRKTQTPTRNALFGLVRYAVDKPQNPPENRPKAAR